MDLWYSEMQTENVRFSIKVEKQLVSVKSEFQQIDIFNSYEFGKILALDGYLMVTEKDEFIYHEMMTHVPMAANPKIETVLVIGAGDGGTVRELVRYCTIKQIDMVEIDKAVVDVCKAYLPQTSSKLTDKRVNIYYEDGMKFVRGQKDMYDLIIIDSTDPFGPGEGLFTKEFYGNCFKALKENGILVNQHESPYYNQDAQAMAKIHQRMKKVFPVSEVYQAHIPTYPSGHWLFGFSSKGIKPVEALDEQGWNNLSISTKYYNTDLHKGAFALPNYVKELLNDENA
ncbi:MAG: polyamine aminopropyltransferase [Defluviitaleaceae bacterium]|nr:polyamine aminopropyltransferase [Defluviitaleaceae bacterium]